MFGGIVVAALASGAGFGIFGLSVAAMRAPLPVPKADGIVVLTDNETWAGREHPAQALENYRRRVNPAVRLVVAAMAANHANVVDPTDANSLGIAGLDAAVPALVAYFLGLPAPAAEEE